MSSDEEKTLQERVNEIKDSNEIRTEEKILKANEKTTNAKIRFKERRLERKNPEMKKNYNHTSNQQKLVLIKL